MCQVTNAASEITGGRARQSKAVFVREGSRVNLTCRFSGHRQPAAWVRWYRGPDLLNTAARGGISITSDKVNQLAI